MKHIRIGSGAGFAGDRLEPALELIEKGNLDYIGFECLAERTIALAQQEKEKDPSTTPQELEARGAGALRRAAKEGDVKYGSCMCGQIAGLVNEEGTCREIVEGICRDAQRRIQEVYGENCVFV